MNRSLPHLRPWRGRPVLFVLLLVLIQGAQAPATRGAAPAHSASPRAPHLPARSDVVFMYQAKPETYQAYGATLLAWGGTPRPQSLRDAEGVRFFGSVGMVTEFARYHDRFPEGYLEGVCRDIRGQPFKVPWLTDHQHQGIPYWWCCTQQPQFRRYIEERVVETVRAGARGVHMDDHLGSAGALFLGGCWCDRCVEGFRPRLDKLPPAVSGSLGITDSGAFDLRTALRGWLDAAPADKPRRLQDHPVWQLWSVYQCQAAASFMGRLRELAAQTAGRPVPFSANAGVLWPNHLVDYQALDFISAEIDHHASSCQLSPLPVFAYRLADAVERPLASTASGQDWAFIKERNLPGLVQGWIALGYAAGHSLMAPHRQWCYTAEKGTHWYAGPEEKFAPLYQFVRRHDDAFDGYETFAELVLVMPHRSFARNRERWFALGDQLTGENVAWRLALGGDDLVEHAIAPEVLEGVQVILNPESQALEASDRERVNEASRSSRCVTSVEEALSGLTPAVRVERGGPVRVFPRVKPGSLAIHVVNWAYEPAPDTVKALPEVVLKLDLAALGVPWATEAQILRPRSEALRVKLDGDRIRLAEVELWSLLLLENDG